MHQPTITDRSRLEQLAGYLAHGINAVQAAAAVGYSSARVSQLLQTEDFQSLVAEKSHELLTQYLDVNKSYDDIEKTALRNVAEALKFNRDPDLNMRAAMLANRAVRRGQFGYQQSPIVATQNVQRINLSLSFNLIQKALNGALDVTPVEVEKGATEENYATPAIVDQILQAVVTNGVELPHDHAVQSRGLAGLLEPID